MNKDNPDVKPTQSQTILPEELKPTQEQLSDRTIELINMAFSGNSAKPADTPQGANARRIIDRFRKDDLACRNKDTKKVQGLHSSKVMGSDKPAQGIV